MALYIGAGNTVTISDSSTLTLPDSDWSFGGWLKFDSVSTAGHTYIYYWQQAGEGVSLYVCDSDGFMGNHMSVFYGSIFDSYGDYWHDEAFGENRNWQHFLGVRSSDVVTTYINGTAVATAPSFNGAVNVPMDWAFGSPLADYHLAEWAKWDVALSGDRSALLAGVRPLDIGPRPAWYVPMLGDCNEQVAGLSVTNNGATVSQHPPNIVMAANVLGI